MSQVLTSCIELWCHIKPRPLQNISPHFPHLCSLLFAMCVFILNLDENIFLQWQHSKSGCCKHAVWQSVLCFWSCFNVQKISEQILQFVLVLFACRRKFDFLLKVSWQTSHWRELLSIPWTDLMWASKLSFRELFKPQWGQLSSLPKWTDTSCLLRWETLLNVFSHLSQWNIESTFQTGLAV